MIWESPVSETCEALTIIVAAPLAPIVVQWMGTQRLSRLLCCRRACCYCCCCARLLCCGLWDPSRRCRGVFVFAQAARFCIASILVWIACVVALDDFGIVGGLRGGIAVVSGSIEGAWERKWSIML